jgi:hypothetical protein
MTVIYVDKSFMPMAHTTLVFLSEKANPTNFHLFLRAPFSVSNKLITFSDFSLDELET